ncbi:MAG: M13 family metallopeptidase [Parvularculaceae bacterium]|nr:M13 family metallopeptidase [Parvularculaceae bacterium]
MRSSLSFRLLAGTALVSCLALAACGQQGGETPSADTEVTAATGAAPELGTFGIEIGDMDTDVRPGDDFNAYVNGGWLGRFEIPAERSSYTRFTALAERSEKRIRTIIEESAAAESKDGSLEQKIGDTFAAFMDTDAIEKAGLAPVAEELAMYDELQSHDEAALTVLSPMSGASFPLGIYVSIDAKQPDTHTVYMTQSGLGMPNRSYYLDEKFAEKAEAYKAFMAQMFGFMDIADPKGLAEDVYAFETKIAEVHWTPAERRDRDKTYNPTTIGALNDEKPGLPWDQMAAYYGLDADQKVVVREPSATTEAARIFAETDLEVIKAYLKFHALDSYSNVLPKEIDEASFGFYGKALRGQPEQRARWQRGVSAVNGSLGEAVGQVYVARHFPSASKDQMEDLVANLREAFAGRLEQLEWMSDETKTEAKKKLDAFFPKIGYPDEWTDYSALEVTDNPVENIRAARKFGSDENWAKLGQPIDRGEWGMTPQTVNAYYSSTRNEIVFPAAILQAPFFDPNADPAVNYGGIGAVIGHEIGHGFDDQGRKSDGSGALRDWWQAEDAERFKAKTDALGAQYATYSPTPGFYIDPQLTMGENIGDLGGLSMAYSAYRLSLGGKEAPIIDGFTGDQRFFMAWAQVWKSLYRTAALEQQVASDPHSNAKFRINGVVRNMDPWYTAFNVEADDELFLPPEERVSIW